MALINGINFQINSESSDAFGARAFVVDREIVKRDTNFASPLNKINEDKFGSKEKEVDNSKFKARHTISKRKSLFDAREISVESIAANGELGIIISKNMFLAALFISFLYIQISYDGKNKNFSSYSSF